MATKETAVKKKTTKKTDKDVTPVETTEDRMAMAFYMLAEVIGNNTACMETLLKALELATAPATVAEQREPAMDSTIDPPVYTDKDCQKVLVDICGTKGKAGALALLQQFGAEKISEINPKHYEAFVKAGTA
jgi:hypothetical protein